MSWSSLLINTAKNKKRVANLGEQGGFTRRDKVLCDAYGFLLARPS
jgi:hypothetical protein